MGRVLIALLAALGIDIADHAVSAFISRYVNKAIDSVTGDEDTAGSETEVPTTPIEPPDPVTIRAHLFNVGSVFRIYLDNLIKSVYTLRKNVLLSKSDILFSTLSTYKNSSLNELVYDLIEEKQITVTEVNNNGSTTKTVGLSNHSCDHIIGLCSRIFKTYLEGSIIHHEQQVALTGFPHRVVICIDAAFRPGNTGFGSRIVAIPPLKEHVEWSATNQKDIFGEDLIYGKIAIIKYKDNNSDVFTYCCVYPKKGEIDLSVANSWFPGNVDIRSWIEKAVPLSSADLVIKEIPYNFLETMIGRLY